MKIEAYILFKRDTGEMVKPLEDTGDPSGMIFDTLADAEESAAGHAEVYGIECDVVRCEIHLVTEDRA